MGTLLLPRPARRRPPFLTALYVSVIILAVNVLLSGLVYQVFILFQK